MRQTILRVAGVVLLLAAVGACESSQAPTTPPTAGPLVVDVESGGSSIFAPDHSPWSGVFGGFILCTRGDAKAVLDSVDFEYKVAPKTSPNTLVRTLTPNDNGIGTALGTLSDLTTGPKKLDGEFSPVQGFSIAHRCTNHQSPGGIELLIELTSNTKGVWVSYATINYHDSRNRKYEARVPWQMVMCGSETEQSTEHFCS